MEFGIFEKVSRNQPRTFMKKANKLNIGSEKAYMHNRPRTHIGRDLPIPLDAIDVLLDTVDSIPSP